MELRIVVNSKQVKCSNCGWVHEYITRPQADAPCDRPAAYPADIALRVANMMAGGAKDVKPIPTDTLVTIERDMRKLPQYEEPNLRRAVLVERSA